MTWFTDRFEREDAPVTESLPARRRRMLLWSMVVVIPLGLFAVATGVNVGIQAVVGQAYAAGDYATAAAWARAGVSLNPVDRYLPPYNLGTVYASDDLLPEAIEPLQTSLDHAPSPEAACYPRANLALTYVRLGNRYYDGGLWQEAINAYRAAKALWAEQPDDVCHDDPSFDQTAEESSEEASQGEQQAQEQQQNQPPDPTQTPSPDPSATPTPDPSATPTPDPSASPTPDPSASPTPDPSASPTPGPTQSPTPGPSGSPTPGQSGSPTPGPSGSPTPGPSGSPTPGPSGSPTPDPSGSPTTGPGGEGDQPSSEALGEKLDELIAQNQAADRERENGGPKHGLADKPW
ncbi:MAG: hypothetical protein KF727_04905 [Microbacteriaceae bacterium]|nr:hypothetical protein [Microbacteriaceae bacterium]